MKVYEISNNIRTRSISPKRSSEVISHLVALLTYFKYSLKHEQQCFIDCPGTNQIAGFHVLDRSRKKVTLYKHIHYQD